MYNVSSAFHQAVANGNHQIAMMIFEDAVFTNNDINVESGIEFKDYFNTNEDLSIGQALSNEISFSFFNDNGYLNDYEFGEFTATIGVMIASETIERTGTIRAESVSHIYIARDTVPYLTRDGNAPASAPNMPVSAILIYDGKVYCRLSNGTIIAYKDSDGTTISIDPNEHMVAKFATWDGKGIFYNKNTRMLKIWEGTNRKTYEFAPLGVFIAERPNVPDLIEVNMTCNDRMMKFEKDMPSASALGITYPTTISNLFVKLCNHVSVPYVSSSFINSTATIAAEPKAFENATMREVMQWIAEASGSNARFNRDGKLVMDWIRSTNLTVDETGYAEFNPYWYKTKKVTKLYNRASDGEYDNARGTGTEAYLIQDNPLLEGVS